MKLINLYILKVVSVLASNVFFIWAIIEFILYLAKGKIFNWWSVILFVFSAILSFAVGLIIYTYKLKAKNKLNNSYSGNKSRFEQKIEELKNKKNENKNN